MIRLGVITDSRASAASARRLEPVLVPYRRNMREVVLAVMTPCGLGRSVDRTIVADEARPPTTPADRSWLHQPARDWHRRGADMANDVRAKILSLAAARWTHFGLPSPLVRQNRPTISDPRRLTALPLPPNAGSTSGIRCDLCAGPAAAVCRVCFFFSPLHETRHDHSAPPGDFAFAEPSFAVLGTGPFGDLDEVHGRRRVGSEIFLPGRLGEPRQLAATPSRSRL